MAIKGVRLASRTKTLKLVNGEWILHCARGHVYIPKPSGACKACVKFVGAQRWVAKGRIRAYKFVNEAMVTPKPELCELCGKNPPTDLDHDHKTKMFRGWICHWCNTRLSLIDEVGLAVLESWVKRGKSNGG